MMVLTTDDISAVFKLSTFAGETVFYTTVVSRLNSNSVSTPSQLTLFPLFPSFAPIPSVPGWVCDSPPPTDVWLAETM